MEWLINFFTVPYTTTRIENLVGVMLGLFCVNIIDKFLERLKEYRKAMEYYRGEKNSKDEENER